MPSWHLTSDWEAESCSTMPKKESKKGREALGAFCKRDYSTSVYRGGTEERKEVTIGRKEAFSLQFLGTFCAGGHSGAVVPRTSYQLCEGILRARQVRLLLSWYTCTLISQRG